jgi:hypothetical protein
MTSLASTQGINQSNVDSISRNRVNKYDFRNMQLNYARSNAIYNEVKLINKKYYTIQEEDDQKIYTYTNDCTVEKLVKYNEILVGPPVRIIPNAAAGADDSRSNIDKYSILQRNVIRSLRISNDYNPFKFEQKMTNHYIRLYENIKLYKEQYIQNKEQKKRSNDMLYSIISSQITIVTLAASIGILFNVGLVASLCIPNTWSAFLPLLYSPNRIYFQGFIDIMYGMKFIGMNDVAALRK